MEELVENLIFEEIGLAYGVLLTYKEWKYPGPFVGPKFMLGLNIEHKCTRVEQMKYQSKSIELKSSKLSFLSLSDNTLIDFLKMNKGVL